MKALVLTEKFLPLSLQDQADPSPGPGQVKLRIVAAALNHRDLWIQQGLYAGLHYPIIPGSDGVGIIVETGDGVNTEWMGKKVLINPSLNWGNLETAQQKEFRILGLPDPGTLAEYVCIDIDNVYPVPAHLSDEEAAALPLAGLTAYRALFSRARLREGEKVLVTGIGGGVALFAFQFALAAGALVYVSSGSQEKLEKAKQLGAAGGANYHHEDWANILKTDTGGFDVIIDGAAGPDFLSLLEIALPGARIVNYGATRGDLPSLNLRRIFWKQLNVLGSTMGSPSDFKAMLEFVSIHRIRPVVDEVFRFENGAAAMQKMEGGHQLGKIVIRIAG